MSGTSPPTPTAAETYRILKHGLKCRDLSGTVVGLAQNATVVVFSVPALPGWFILRDALGWYVPVRDQFLADISVSFPQDGSTIRPFPPAALADSTTHDTLEAEPVEMIVADNLRVCDSHGKPLAIAAGSVVGIFAHSADTFAWFHTRDGQIFVVDAHRPIRMREMPSRSAPPQRIVAPTARMGNGPERSLEETVVESIEPRMEAPVVVQGGNALPPLALNPTVDAEGEAEEDTASPSVPARLTSRKTPTQEPLPSLPVPNPEEDLAARIPERPAPEITGSAAPGVPIRNPPGLFLSSSFPDPEPAPPALDANDPRGVRTTPQNFLMGDLDFCWVCYSFNWDHADWCPEGRLDRG